MRVVDLQSREEYDHYSFKVRFLGDSSESTRAASGVEGLLLLNPKTGMIVFHDPSSPSSAPVVSYSGKAISDISTEISGKLRKKQILKIEFEEGTKQTTVKFETLGKKANTVAAAILSFRNEIESTLQKTETFPHEPQKIFGTRLGELAHSLEKTIEEEVKKISATVQETIATLPKLDELGQKLKLDLQLQDSPEETTVTLDEFVKAAESSGIFEAIFGALMAKGMVSAANEDWKTSLETLRKARDEARKKKRENQIEEADRQIKRIEAQIEETDRQIKRIEAQIEETDRQVEDVDQQVEESIQQRKKPKIPGDYATTSQENGPVFKHVTMQEAQRYLEGVEQVISEWESEKSLEGERDS